MFIIEDELKKLPENPGVYIMKDKNNEIIYIGKAISLKKRVRQYFNSLNNSPQKVVNMVQNIVQFEYIVTDNELEALVLECNLIKQHRPKYNILLKDDKHYPYLKITLNEEFPRVLTTRRLVKDGSRYFGPFTNLGALNDTLDTIKKVFPIRTCSIKINTKKNHRPCLNYHINQCKGPCAGLISKEDYRIIVDDIIDLLNGKYTKIMDKMHSEMNTFAEKLEFEKAVVIRDKINNIKIITEKQKVLSTDNKDRDVIGYAYDDSMICSEVFFIRGGKLIGRQSFFIENIFGLHEENIGSFIKQFYIDASFIPSEILIMGEIPEKNLVEEMISEKRGKKVTIITPIKGEKSELLKMVKANAKLQLDNYIEKHKFEAVRATECLNALKDLLSLSKIPTRIEAFDISNTGSLDIVAGMIVFKDGMPFKEGYRRYKINSVKTQDDYSSMKEVLDRRIGKIKNSKDELPDLILVDGGINHLKIALKVLSEHNLQIPAYGMQKDDKHKSKSLVSIDNEYDIMSDVAVMRIVISIQDEAHRFALSYNKLLRSKRYSKSILDNIEGVGAKRKKALIKHFGSIDKIKKANMEELLSVEGIDKKVAATIIDYFNNGENE